MGLCENCLCYTLSTFPKIFLHKTPLPLPLCSAFCSFLPDQTPAEGSKIVKYGKPNPSQEECSAFDLDICPDLLLAGIAAAGAAALIALYVALTMNPNGRRKRRRSLDDEGHQFFSNTDLFLVGRFKFSNFGLQVATEEAFSPLASPVALVTLSTK